MANVPLKIPQGPFWPLGDIIVVTPGAPVNIMSLVDPSLVNDPNAATSATAAEYTVRAQQIVFQGFKQTAGAAPMIPNVGNVYILKRGGTASKDNAGSLIGILLPGGEYEFASAPLNKNVFTPYDIVIDADNAGDAAIVTLVIQ
jgi:hypothetical protein